MTRPAVPRAHPRRPRRQPLPAARPAAVRGQRQRLRQLRRVLHRTAWRPAERGAGRKVSGVFHSAVLQLAACVQRWHANLPVAHMGTGLARQACTPTATATAT